MSTIRERLSDERFPYAEQDLRAAAVLAHRIAEVGRRREGETVTYSDLVADVQFQLETVNGGRPYVIRTESWTALDRSIVSDFLGYISKQTYLEGEFFAGAMVVQKDEGGSGMPSRPFFDWAVKLGALSDLSDASVTRFWLDQLRKAHAWYQSHDRDTAIRGIETTAGVCGGEPRVARTRIPVWLLEQARRLGASQSDLLRAYPTLQADDLARAWAYAQSHPQEIERQIREHEEA